MVVGGNEIFFGQIQHLLRDIAETNDINDGDLVERDFKNEKYNEISRYNDS